MQANSNSGQIFEVMCKQMITLNMANQERSDFYVSFITFLCALKLQETLRPVLFNTYSMKQSNLYYFEAIKMTSQA